MIPNQGAEATAAGARPRPTSVLVIDDNAEIRAVLCAMLEEHGFVAHAAGGMEDSLRRLAAQSYDAAVIDLVMPLVHGLQVLQELRRSANAQDIPAVVLSTLPEGATRDDAAAQASALGGAELLDKPVTAGRLVCALERLLASR